DSVTNFIRGSSLFVEDSPAFLADMGKTFFDQKRYDSARFYMRKAVNKDPDNVQYYNTLGLSFQGLKLYDSARVNLQKANRLSPDNRAVLQNLSNVFRLLKK